MTTLTSNISAANSNAILSLSFEQIMNKKIASSKHYSSYTPVSKHVSRKSLAKLFSMDWDLNMNELEFE